jgi:hypothetical protein
LTAAKTPSGTASSTDIPTEISARVAETGKASAMISCTVRFGYI